MKIKSLKILIVFSVTLLLVSCGTKRVVPITGREYRVAEGAFSDPQMLQMSKSVYGQYILESGGDSRDRQKTAMVKSVADRLIKVTNDYLRKNGYANELQYYEWDVHLVPAPGQVNATCMAGGKILVFEEILPIAQNDAGLAAILGHEIGHAIGHHIAEQLTKEKKKQIGQVLGSAGIGILGSLTRGSQDEVGQVINQGVDLSNQVMQYFEMKYSRKHEHEADHIGMILMAMAGYDPHEAPKVWTRMTQNYGDNTNRILSTHPSNAKRQRWMETKWMSEAMRYYNQSKERYTNLYVKQNNNVGKQSTTYVVNTQKLNVRSASSSKSKVIGSLFRGQIVKVKNIQNGWAIINFKGMKGYVRIDYLKKKL